MKQGLPGGLRILQVGHVAGYHEHLPSSGPLVLTRMDCQKCESKKGSALCWIQLSLCHAQTLLWDCRCKDMGILFTHVLDWVCVSKSSTCSSYGRRSTAVIHCPSMALAPDWSWPTSPALRIRTPYGNSILTSMVHVHCAALLTKMQVALVAMSRCPPFNRMEPQVLLDEGCYHVLRTYSRFVSVSSGSYNHQRIYVLSISLTQVLIL